MSGGRRTPAQLVEPFAKRLYEERRRGTHLGRTVGDKPITEMGEWDELDEVIRDEWRSEVRRVIEAA